MLIRYGCALLRPIEEKDYDLLYSMINDPEIEDMTMGWNYPISKYQQWDFVKNFKNSDRGIKLMVELTNGKTIGMVTVDDIDWKNRTAYTGYKVSADYEDRMRGDMLDAMTGLNNYLFNEWGMNCLYGRILDDNIFSQKLSRKLHAKVEGIMRQRIFKRGKFHDVLSTSLLREEFNSFFEPKDYLLEES